MDITLISKFKHRRGKAKISQELGRKDKTEDHTCPVIQLVPSSYVNAVDKLSGQGSPQIGVLLKQGVKGTSHLFQMSAGMRGKKQMQIGILLNGRWKRMECWPTLYQQP